MAVITETTLSAAVTGDQTRVVTPASMAGIVLGDWIFTGQEVMQVQVVGTTTVDVQRGVGGTRASDHASGDRMFHGPPAQFESRDPRDVDANAQVDTPWINVTNGTIWIVGGDNRFRRIEDRGPSTRPVRNYGADGAIAVEEGVHLLTGTDTAYTLAAPTAEQEGMTLIVTTQSTDNYVVTATNLFVGDSGATLDDVATFADLGGTLVLMAINLLWHVVSNKDVTIT